MARVNGNSPGVAKGRYSQTFCCWCGGGYGLALLVIDRMIFVGESVGAPTIQFEDEDLVNGQFKNAHDHCWLITASPSAVGFYS